MASRQVDSGHNRKLFLFADLCCAAVDLESALLCNKPAGNRIKGKTEGIGSIFIIHFFPKVTASNKLNVIFVCLILLDFSMGDVIDWRSLSICIFYLFSDLFKFSQCLEVQSACLCTIFHET